MGGYLLHEGATVQCLHAGSAQPTTTDQRVSVSGQAIVTLDDLYTIAACSLTPPNGGPCASAQWIKGAERVKASGVPVLLQDSEALCTPTGTGLQVINTQTRVQAT